MLLSATESVLVLPEVEAITVWRMLDLVYTGRCLVTKELDKLKLVQLLTSLGMDSVANNIEMELLTEEKVTSSASPKSMVSPPSSVFECEEHPKEDIELRFHKWDCNKKVPICLTTDPTIDSLKNESICENQTLLLDLDEELSFEDIVKYEENDLTLMIKDEVPNDPREVPNSPPELNIKKTRRPSKKGESVCDTCERVFSCKSLLRRHVKTAHIKPEDRVVCEVCCKVFRAQHLVQQHVREVHSSVTFGCEVCGKTFRSKCNLKRHLETHTTEKIYHCHLCDKSFTTPKYLSHHHIVEHKLKKAPCNVCGKMYKNKYLMHKHFKRYHGTKK